MSKYIEREKAIECIRNYALEVYGADLTESQQPFTNEAKTDNFCEGLYEATEVVANVPAADVNPERHGRWSDEMVAVNEEAVGYHNDDVRFGFQCSECGGVLNYKTKYCGNCGAKMDGKDCENDDR